MDNSFHLELYDPETDTIEVLVDRKIAGHDHSAQVLGPGVPGDPSPPGGLVYLLGGYATDLHGDPHHIELGILVLQTYKPPYFIKGPLRSLRTCPTRSPTASGSTWSFQRTREPSRRWLCRLFS